MADVSSKSRDSITNLPVESVKYGVIKPHQHQRK